MTWIKLIMMLAVGQGILLSALLFSSKKNKTANIYFAVLIFMITFKLALPFFYDLVDYEIFRYPLMIGDCLIFLFPALHFSYAYFLIFPEKHKTPKKFLLFIPFVFLVIWLGISIPDSPYTIYTNSFIYGLFLYSCVIYSLMLMFVVIRLINKYQKNLRDNLSNIEKIDLNWLKLITYTFIVMNLLVIFVYQFTNITISPIVEAILIFMAGYFGLRQSEIFNSEQVPPVKYKTSGLTSEKSNEIKTQLLSLLDDEKIYLKEGLTVSDLSSLLNVTNVYLSQVINERFNLSFYNLIAKYRSEEAARRLKADQYKHHTLSSIGFDVGFGSKSTFNSAFKKYIGVTPSEYRKS